VSEPEVPFSTTVVRGLLDLHHDIVRLKYLYLKIVESHQLKEPFKAEYKSRVVELATGLNAFFNDLRFRKISKFNMDEVERNIQRYLVEAHRQVTRTVKAGLKALSGKINLNLIPAGEGEVDGALLASRVSAEQALEKDKLDYLNAAKSYLLEVAGPPDRDRTAAKRQSSAVDRALLELKLRAFEQAVSGYASENVDVLYKVRLKIEKALDQGVRVHVAATGRSEPAVLNHNELYLQDRGMGNYSVSYREKSLGFLFELLLLQQIGDKPPRYRGEISGWAESGINRAGFSLKDRPGPTGGEPSGASTGPAAAAFLQKTGLTQLYTRIGRLCEEKSQETVQLQQRVEREIKRQVSKALDEAW
jgi:hypothetical protein